MTTPRIIRAEPILDLATLLNGWHLVHVGINLAGDLAVLCSNQLPRSRFGYGVRNQSGARVEQNPERFRILAPMRHGTRVVELAGKDRVWQRIQPLGRDSWVLAFRRPHSVEAAIGIVSAGGQLLSSFDAGMGIHDLQVAPDGRIWVFYDIEGMETASEADQAFSQHGAICFSPRGEQLFRYHDLARTYPDHNEQLKTIPRIYFPHGRNVADNATTWIWTCEALVELEGY